VLFGARLHEKNRFSSSPDAPPRVGVTDISPEPGMPSPLVSARIGNRGPTICMAPWAPGDAVNGPANTNVITSGKASAQVNAICLTRSLILSAHFERDASGPPER
jgi:hypothetical protein